MSTQDPKGADELPAPAEPPAPAVAVFARAPEPGRAKTRLIPLLGAEGAAAFQKALIHDTLLKISRGRRPLARYLFVSSVAPVDVASLLGSMQGCQVICQEGEDLGERLRAAFRLLLQRHRVAVVVGSDSPLLAGGVIRAAARKLAHTDAVIGPALDGGFYLIGLSAPRAVTEADVFADVRWGTRYAFRDMLRNLLRHEFRCSVLKRCGDIDRPADLKRLLKQMTGKLALYRRAPDTWMFLTARLGRDRGARRRGWAARAKPAVKIPCPARAD